MGTIEVESSLKQSPTQYPIYFYKYLINGGYYFFLVPFKLSTSDKSSNLELQRNPNHKVRFPKFCKLNKNDVCTFLTISTYNYYSYFVRL